MPDELIPLLPDSTLRAELLESPEGVSVVNHFGGEMSVKSRSEQGLRLSLDRLTELEVGLLPHGESYYICLIATSTIVPAQSVVTLFDADWNRLQEIPFTLTGALHHRTAKYAHQALPCRAGTPPLDSHDGPDGAAATYREDHQP